MRHSIARHGVKWYVAAMSELLAGSGDALPVSDVLPKLIQGLTQRPNAVLVAPPGAGKTTLAPLALMDAFPGQKILLLEPRRLAARAAAMRMSAMLGERVGQRIGFRTRLESAVSSATVIEVITEGLLTSRLLADPGLTGIGMVIFDEVHERSLEADLAMALTLDLQHGLRPELRILAMSATAETERLATLLNAPVIESVGRMHEVKLRHSPRDIPTAREMPEAMAKAIRAALVEHEGDILAFLPGMGEIRRTESALAGCPALVLPLHGDLPPAAQDLALRQNEKRRVVLATSIAETSLTVPGVRIVVDGGFRRAPKLDTATGLTRLATLRISRAAATQRAGRAGREAPGVAIRLWSEALHRGLPGFERPEILEAELSGLVLACLAWGEAPEDLPFPDAPPIGALTTARGLLTVLGALNEGKLTPMGREMARLRATPRLAAMMLAARNPLEQALAADLAALLEERDPLGRDAPADVSLRLEALLGRAEGDRGALTRIRQAGRIYRSRLGLAGNAVAAGDAGHLFAAAFPDRIGQSRGDGSFRLSGGGSGNLVNATDPLRRQKLLAVASLDAKGSKIRLAAALDADALPTSLDARLISRREAGFDEASGSVLIRERLRLGALVLADRNVPAGPEETQTALTAALANRLDRLDWNEAVRNFLARVALMRGLDSSYPDLSRETLAANAEDWLAPYLTGMRNIREAAALDLMKIFRGMMSYEQLKRLDEDLPAHLDLPGGQVTLDYTTPVPIAAARAKQFYGLDETPLLAGGRVKLQLALLSPAGRPIAVTGDLKSFWRNGWLDARRDMRGRYPKHDWPEQPWTVK